MPMPSAAFSPFTTQASTSSSDRIVCRRSSSARLPGAPTTSAMKRMRKVRELSRDAAGDGYGTPSVADGKTWSATLFPPSAA